MTTAGPAMDPIRRALAAKAAIDSGWELPPSDEAGGLRCGSARFAGTALISPWENGGFVVTFSESRLARELQRSAFTTTGGNFAVSNDRELDRLMHRAAELSLSLPEAPLEEFKRRAATTTIGSTEAERLVRQRIGQDCFRAALLALWDRRCALTGLDVPALLRASHAKPWAMCESDQERLDPFNGLLLAPHLDALFDGGWISFTDDGALIVSSALPDSARQLLLNREPRQLRWVTSEHRPYLDYHRERVFRRNGSAGLDG